MEWLWYCIGMIEFFYDLIGFIGKLGLGLIGFVGLNKERKYVMKFDLLQDLKGMDDDCLMKLRICWFRLG